MTKKIIIIFGIVIIALLLGLLVLTRRNVSEGYEQFEEQNNLKEEQSSNNWISTGLELETVISKNKDLLDSYKIDLSNLTPQDFYYDGSSWDVTVLSNDNIPYKIIVTPEFSVILNPLTGESLDGESE